MTATKTPCSLDMVLPGMPGEANSVEYDCSDLNVSVVPVGCQKNPGMDIGTACRERSRHDRLGEGTEPDPDAEEPKASKTSTQSLNARLAAFRDVDSSIDTMVSTSKPLAAFFQHARGRVILVLCMIPVFATAMLLLFRPPGADGFRFPDKDNIRAGDFVMGTFFLWINGAQVTLVWLAWRGQSEAFKMFLAGTAFAIAPIALLLCVAYMVDGKVLLGLRCLVWLHWLPFISNIFSERNIILRLIMRLGLQQIALGLFCLAIKDYLWTAFEGLPGIQFCVIYVFLVMRRRAGLAKAAALVKEDAEKYRSIWEGFLATQAQAIGSLEVLSWEVRDRCPKDVPRHACPDLDELYRQAGRLRPLFHAKLESWASATGGKTYVGTQKSADRAVQKIKRSYAGDACRLLDICRGCLTFVDFQSLRHALELIGRDPEVRLMRIKNRFDRSYDAHKSAGYRDVSLILQIVSEKACYLGLEYHCCELQLHIDTLYESKTDGGHKRYVQWRNMRCE
mmetsp:Transcript_1385/g.3059  ORF Transcript_1385/g.3059 Transcript_1385/m.3059 type:complete len:507 (-) Transcript_1385:161-1681(-)